MTKKKLELYENQEENGMYFGLNISEVVFLHFKKRYDENAVIVKSIGYEMNFSHGHPSLDKTEE